MVRPARGKKTARPAPYDPDLLDNWTLARLKTECQRLNIVVASNIRRPTLIRLIKEHERARQQEGDSPSLPTLSQDEPRPSTQDGGRDAAQLEDVLNNVLDALGNIEQRLDVLERRNTTPAHPAVTQTTQNASGVTGGPLPRSEAQLSVQQPHELHHNWHLTAPAPVDVPPSTSVVSRDFTLSSAYSQFGSPRRSLFPSAAAGSPEQLAGPVATPGPRDLTGAVRTQYGYSVSSLPEAVTVSPALRQAIIQGKDVNLAALLIPYFRGSGDNTERLDSREFKAPNKPLTIGQFIQAFSMYKSVMCAAFPHRRAELDEYECLIVDMASRFPGFGFYEYHTQFSQKAAAYLRHDNINVDWSIRDERLFNNIFAGRSVNSCNFCGSTSHGPGFCQAELENPRGFFRNQDRRALADRTNQDSRPPASSRSADSTVDSHGRARTFHQQKEICNNFNGSFGCKAPKCPRAHICSSCKADHSLPACPLAQAQPQQKKA